MSVIRYCWRCRMDIPMLDEVEWAEIDPLLSRFIEQVKQHRATQGSSLTEALHQVQNEACAVYFRMTGFAETNYRAIYHHRNALFGQDCIRCHKPFRTPQARYCVECGFGMESIS